MQDMVTIGDVRPGLDYDFGDFVLLGDSGDLGELGGELDLTETHLSQLIFTLFIDVKDVYRPPSII